jgi:hypothetical protein
MVLWWSFQRSLSSINSVFCVISLMKDGNEYYRMLRNREYSNLYLDASLKTIHVSSLAVSQQLLILVEHFKVFILS